MFCLECGVKCKQKDSVYERFPNYYMHREVLECPDCGARYRKVYNSQLQKTDVIRLEDLDALPGVKHDPFGDINKVKDVGL